MKIFFESELMENRKQATVLTPGRAFEALQAKDGDAIFFSVGTDGVFYVTREASATTTGWDRTDLSTALAASHGGAAVTAKSFAVGQNVGTGAVDVALVITVGGQDFLYLSLGNATTDAGWAKPVAWTAIPFDAGTAPSPLTIADVYLANIGGTQTIFADILRAPGDPLQLLDRYYITPGSTQKWNPHQLAVDLAAGSIASCLGQPSGQPLSGIYTFGSIGGTPELIFTPQYNYFEPTAAPSPVRLTLPAGASAVASAIDAAGTSNLFVAATGGLSVFTPGNQHDQSDPAQVIAGGAFAGAATLAAATSGGRTAVWGLNPQGQLCYAACAAGSEGTPSAWSHPVPLVDAAGQFAFFLNLSAGSNVLFASVSGTGLIQLSQDPVTGGWSQRSILLPSTAVGDVVAQDTYTTHISVTDDNQVAVPNAALSITATSPVSAYLNDVYYQLSPTVAVHVTADATGVLTVVQETATVAAPCFQVTAAATKTDTKAATVGVNPMSKAQDTLATIKSGANLAAVTVTDSTGATRPLVPATVSAGDRDAAASALAQLTTVSAGLPANGSRKVPAAAAAGTPAVAGVPPVWGLSFTSGGLAYHEGDAAGLRPGAAAPEDIGGGISIAAGDLFQWIGQAATTVESFVVQEVQGVCHFVVTVAGQVYDALLDCYNAVVGAAEFVLSKIEVFFADLVQWLGFIFQWADIVRTHQVLRNIFRQYAANCLANVAGSRAQVTQSFTSLQHYLSSWAGIPANVPPALSGATVGGTTASATPLAGIGSPQGNFGLQQLQGNTASSTMVVSGSDLSNDMLAAFETLDAAVTTETEVIQTALTSIQTNIIDKYSDLTVAQITEGFIAILGDALLQSAENVLLAAINFLGVVGNTFLDLMDETVDIPVISALYQEISGDDLSLLDAICLITAIPVTIEGKLVAGATPFPDNATTAALINASDWNAIRQACNAAPAGKAGAMAPHTDLSQPTDDVNRVLALAGGGAAFVGAIAESILVGFAKKAPQAVVPPVLAAIFYLPYNMPSFIGDIPDLEDANWSAIMNQILTDLMTLKMIADAAVAFIAAQQRSKGQNTDTADKWQQKISPWLDAISCVIWMIPTIAPTFGPTDATKYSFSIMAMDAIGGACFDLSGVLSPDIAGAKDLESCIGFVTAVGVFNFIYGSLAAAAGGLSFVDQKTS
jgi:hypothetical protein